MSAQIVFFSHGGGPLPLLGDPGHLAMISFMRKLPERLRKPEAILVISAHWEEKTATLLGSANPPMFYDYYGFPPETYSIVYPSPGNPELAARIANLLDEAAIPSRIDTSRGYDHGHFVPLMLMYPEANIPSIQLSLLRGLAPAAHIALGKALRPLREENILIIGSGFSYHNLQEFFAESQQRADPANDAFQDWLIDTFSADIPQDERERRMLDWEKAPSARYCHPREEHLLPLFVCAAIAGGPAELIFDDTILGKRSVAFQFLQQ
ncbi:MAG TPA: dioxygenase [Spirochaetaceae bacterium]|jgi:4,5-DOPA dioxygenase extradiol|nr:dioxygenase [Spirochaetaceae bacterium]